MNSAELIRELQRAGWQRVRTRGSHYAFQHPLHAGTIVVPHPKKELGKGLVTAIRRQAGLKTPR